MIKNGKLLEGKEVHFRLTTNDLLERGKLSKIAFGTVTDKDKIVKDLKIVEKEYTEYSPATFSGKIWDKLTGKNAKKESKNTVVFVQEKNGSISADDHRYIEWLIKEKKETPKVYLIPEKNKKENKKDTTIHLLDDKDMKKLKNSFWKRQYKKFLAVPAKITKDALIATIPRTLIPIIILTILAYTRRNEISIERILAYASVSIGFIAIGFALIFQTILNWMTFWSEFTSEACEPAIEKLERWLQTRKKNNNFTLKISKAIIGILRFLGARGDVLIAGPLLGIGAVFLSRLALGPVGQTTSVFTMSGFLLILANIFVGSITSGPYSQIVAHLRSVGKITNKTSTYLGIFDTFRLSLGKVADFGYQVLYNIIQLVLGVVFWVALLISDRLFPKHKVTKITNKDDLDFINKTIQDLQKQKA